jgi:hypothetical protein
MAFIVKSKHGLFWDLPGHIIPMTLMERKIKIYILYPTYLF